MKKYILILLGLTLLSCKKNKTTEPENTMCQVDESYFDGFKFENTLDGERNISTEKVVVSHLNFTPALGEMYPGYSVLLYLSDAAGNSHGIRGTTLPGYGNKIRDIELAPLLQGKKYRYTVTLKKFLNPDDMPCLPYPYDPVIVDLPHTYSFETRSAKFPIGQITDREGNIYETVTIGNQEWLAQDLRLNFYPNGDTIPNFSSTLNTPLPYPHFNNSRTYLPGATAGSKNPCPMGWHVPTVSEFEQLHTTLQQLYGNKYMEEMYIGYDNETYLSFNVSGWQRKYLTSTLKNDSTVFAFRPDFGNKNTPLKVELTTIDAKWDEMACIRCIKD